MRHLIAGGGSLFGAVQVSDAAVAPNYIQQSNTSRNIAVDASGNIYVLFRNATNGILVEKIPITAPPFQRQCR